MNWIEVCTVPQPYFEKNLSSPHPGRSATPSPRRGPSAAMRRGFRGTPPDANLGRGGLRRNRIGRSRFFNRIETAPDDLFCRSRTG